MRIGIDASNLRSRGGINHLAELLLAIRPEECGVKRVVVWGGRSVLDRLSEKPWLDLIHVPTLDGLLLQRFLWQQTKLSQLARKDCELLFIPGGTYLGTFKPVVAMSHNVLPFEWAELCRYGLSWSFIRLVMLCSIQTWSFRRADGVIFLTEYARSVVQKRAKTLNGHSIIIPHGLGERFRLSPKTQKPISLYSESHPFKLLYISIVDLYKHQWHVAEAVSQLRLKGLPVVLDLIGPSYDSALKRLQNTIARIDPAGKYVRYKGPVPYNQVATIYHQADAFVFASSCESISNILIEAMGAGLPIACSNRRPMSEILGGGGVYFNPEDPQDIAEALRKLIMSPDLRERCASIAYERALQYSWERCARETFSFLAEVARDTGISKA